MKIDIDFSIPKTLQKKLETDNYSQVLKKSVRDLSNWSENKLGENILKMVYGSKIGKSYQFTGRLQKGRKSRTFNDYQMSIESNPILAGAKINYAGFVNFGTRKMKGRPFFDQTLKDAKTEAKTILKNNLNKIINND